MSDSVDRLYEAVRRARTRGPGAIAHGAAAAVRPRQDGEEARRRSGRSRDRRHARRARRGRAAKARTCSTIWSCCGLPPACVRRTSGPKWRGASGCSASPKSCRRIRGVRAGRRKVVALDSRRVRKRALIPPHRPALAHPRLPWTISGRAVKQARHAPPPLRSMHQRRRQTPCVLDHGRGVVCGELVLSGAARRHADPDVAGAARQGLVLRARCAH